MSLHPDAELARNEYFDRQLNLPAVKLLPGEYHVTDKDMVQVTVLGSCVAACIRDKVFAIGGMNHFMLPDAGTDGLNRYGASTRYGVYAMEMLINQILKRGGRRENLQAKLFGGGNVMAVLSKSSVGERNAEFALKFLEVEGIPLLAQDLDDVYPRKVYHYPASGRVRVKKIVELHNQTILEREVAYRRKIERTGEGGEIELFS
jgi:chemotaxis protein CheD